MFFIICKSNIQLYALYLLFNSTRCLAFDTSKWYYVAKWNGNGGSGKEKVPHKHGGKEEI